MWDSMYPAGFFEEATEKKKQMDLKLGALHRLLSAASDRAKDFRDPSQDHPRKENKYVKYSQGIIDEAREKMSHVGYELTELDYELNPEKSRRIE
ncbi:MAG: hypothetical protein Q9166_000679 [cf. Caloplaca sp. 2 TL-2023]